MHYSCLHIMKKLFVDKYLDPNKKLRILEVGSMDMSKPRKDLIFRRYFRDNPNWEFIGLDLEKGRNVDVVSKYPYKYPFPDNSFDVVISGNVLEHVEDLHRIVKEIARITKDLVCIIVPNTRAYHAKPIDCWRIFPDGMRFLLEEVAELEALECRVAGNEKVDTIGIARKRK